MITEDYVSFETARLLKEKGFNEKVICYYDDGGSLNLNKFVEFQCCNQGYGSSVFAAPTLQMVMKWLREVHNICITIYPDKAKGYEAVLYDTKDNVEIILQSFGVYGSHIFGDSYEEACEAAIKYCLENLI